MGGTRLDESSGHGGYAFGPFVVDAVKRRLWRESRLVPITSKTFDVLIVLLEHRDHVVSKDELLNRVWPNTAVNENNLARQISSLRRALGQRPDQHDFVVTIPGHGYRFVATVQDLTDVPPELPTDHEVHLHVPPEPPVDREAPGSSDEAPCEQPVQRASTRRRPPGLTDQTPTGRCTSTRDACRHDLRNRCDGRGDGAAPSCESRLPTRDEPCSASPMTRRLCRARRPGRPTVSGWYTRATAREMPTSGNSVSAIPTLSADDVRDQRIATAVVARWTINRIPLGARWRWLVRHSGDRRCRTHRLQLRLRASLVAGRNADSLQAIGRASRSAHDLRCGPRRKAAPSRSARRRRRSVTHAPARTSAVAYGGALQESVATAGAQVLLGPVVDVGAELVRGAQRPVRVAQPLARRHDRVGLAVGERSPRPARPSLISPTALTGTPASRRTCAANATW